MQFGFQYSINYTSHHRNVLTLSVLMRSEGKRNEKMLREDGLQAEVRQVASDTWQNYPTCCSNFPKYFGLRLTNSMIACEDTCLPTPCYPSIPPFSKTSGCMKTF